MEREIRMWRTLAACGLAMGLLMAGMAVGEANAQKAGGPPEIVCKKVSFPKYNDSKYYEALNQELAEEQAKGYKLVQLIPWMFATMKVSSAMACFEKPARELP